jgi:biopolymer transport protein ExbD
MNDFGFPQRKKKTIEELNVVPILDMFVSIVFFLLLSTSMVGMTKIVLPPSATSTVESTNTKIPLNPKLFVIAAVDKPGFLKIILKWEGNKPGSDSVLVAEDIFRDQTPVVNAIKDMLKKFKNDHAEEKTVQISLQSGMAYQWLISAMDGAREILPDMILSSYQVADGMRE